MNETVTFNDDPVLQRTSGYSSHLVLNRPKALNSLNHDMVEIVRECLRSARDDDAISQVVVTSEHPKAFCAGGDVRFVRECILNGNPDKGELFFADEYQMNAEIAEFSEVKPYIAVIDGIAMGGGLGVSMHGSHRIVTERASAAMPEMAIGFIPDVGITHFSQQLVTADGSSSEAIARFIALTGYRMTAADLLWSGWATHFVPSESLPDFLQSLDANGVDEALAQHSLDPTSDSARELLGESHLAEWHQCIEACFGFDTWLEMENALDERFAGGEHCTRENINTFNKLLRTASAASLVAGAELMTANAQEGVALRDALRNEMVVGKLMREHRNFAEGVRAVLVDKDRNSRFDPHRADAVDPQQFRDAMAAKS